jgi:hypothetical protein
MGVDNTTRDVEVYLFDRLLLTVKEKNSSASKANPKKRKYALKGFIYLEHINRVVDISAGGNPCRIKADCRRTRLEYLTRLWVNTRIHTDFP